MEEQYLLEAYRSGWISSLGEYINRFERDFTVFCGVRYATAVSNGTVALHLALLASNVGDGDEVIVPALTFAATAAAVVHCRARPVFVDSSPLIGTVDPQCVELAITKRTKAIIAVHLYGHPADMDPIITIARKHNLLVIEDAAEAHGASYKGKRVGSMGDIATFSFYGNKILTTGEGGMVVTDNPALHERVRFYKDHAMDVRKKYWHPDVGYNYRITNLQAAIGCAQIARYSDIIAWRRKTLSLYRDQFRDVEGVTINPSEPWADPVPWMICCVLRKGGLPEKRDKIILKLREAGIDSRPYFYLLCDMPPYIADTKVSLFGRDMQVANDLSNRGLNLPMLRRLKMEDVIRVKEVLIKCLKRDR